jgi:hypothetical protein
MMKFMYSLMAMLFSIVVVPNVEKKPKRCRQHHEIRKRHPSQEAERRARRWRGRTALVRKEPRRDDAPLIQDVRNAEDDPPDDRHLHVHKELSERLQVLQTDGGLAGEELCIDSHDWLEQHRIHDPVDKDPAENHADQDAGDGFDEPPAEFFKMIEEGHFPEGS